MDKNNHSKIIYNTLILYSDTNMLKVKGWKKIYHANRNQKRGEEAIPKLDQVDIKIKIITGGKLWHFIMIKLIVLQEYIAIIDIHLLNNRATKHKKKKTDRIKGCNNYKIIVGDFNNQLSIMTQTTRHDRKSPKKPTTWATLWIN